LTAVDAGTRAGRFMLQDLIGLVVPSFRDTSALVPGLTATGLCVAAWGFFLYQGVTDPLGGVNTLWPLFGISNQMLAAVALILGTVVLFRMKKQRYAWTTILPASWLVLCTLVAGWQKVASADPRVGFLSHAKVFSDKLAAGEVMAPAQSREEMARIIFNDRVDAALCVLFMAVVLSMIFFGIRACRKAYLSDRVTTRESHGAHDAREAGALLS
ncbi:MAG TPA: carbon starvation CstA 5TM domain-containing protein, partial [Croceibacterium sp.]|nr:carbon starvation CstA 5TM domain-containing protein [Croceibacterium sp.]